MVPADYMYSSVPTYLLESVHVLEIRFLTSCMYGTSHPVSYVSPGTIDTFSQVQ